MKTSFTKGILLCLSWLLVMSGCSSAPADQTAAATASAQGFGDEVSVTITATDGKLSDVQITGDKETENVGGRAITTLRENMIASGSVEVEAISGATVTSNAVSEAVAKAFAAFNASKGA